MPALNDILARLAVVPTTTALLGLAVTAGLLVAMMDWRISVLALVVQYGLAGLLLTRIIRPEIALIKTLAGAMICVVLYVTARRAGWGHPKSDDEEEPPNAWLMALTRGLPFRVLSALMGIALAFSAAVRQPLPNVSLEVTFAAITLGMMGILCITLSGEPLKAGIGLLTAISGFDMFYSSVEQSLAVVGVLGIVNFMIALAIAYLATAQAHVAQEGEKA